MFNNWDPKRLVAQNKQLAVASIFFWIIVASTFEQFNHRLQYRPMCKGYQVSIHKENGS